MSGAARSLLAGAALAWLASAPAARIYQYEDVKATYVDQINHVVTCGNWPDGDQLGSYRLLEVVVYAQSLLFVQWLAAPDPDTGLRAVRATYGPPELNNDHADVSLRNLRCHAQGDGIRVTARAYSGHENRWRSLQILAGHAPGAAQLQFLPDGGAAQHGKSGALPR